MRRFTLPLSLGLALCLLAGGRLPPACAQMPKPDKVRFETVDQVELHGTFWPNPKGRKAPCVLLLHKYGGKSHDDGWDKLAVKLQEQGCAVLSFDFRGHGDSTNVGDSFWTFPFNQSGVKGYKRGAIQQPTTISHQDFLPRYIPYLVNDISAARLFLERKNDGSECNISNLILIGAEEGATLGNLWLVSECYRYRAVGGNIRFPVLAKKPESKDVVACVWLSLSPRLPNSGSVKLPVPVQSWLGKAGREQKIPMFFIYGSNDAATTLVFMKAIKPSYVRGQKPMARDEFVATGEWGVKTKLAGSKLLADSLGTEKRILKNYLTNLILEKRADNEWEKRASEKANFMWRLGVGGRAILAKAEGEKNLLPIPLSVLGLR